MRSADSVSDGQAGLPFHLNSSASPLGTPPHPPSHGHPPPPPGWPPPGVRVLTVGELTREIKGKIEGGYGQVWVEGEVSNLARPRSGNQYLTLKDEEAPLKAVLYRGIALRMKFDLRDGMRVIVRGRLTVFMPRGEYQLLIEEIQPRGVGPLELAFRQLKEKLSVRGYFEPKRKKKLPRIPHRVVLVTSPSGSAVRDMVQILSRRWPAAEVWIYPVSVQGEGASAEMAEALEQLNAIHQGGQHSIDVILLGRGGGSLEDLWPFNEEVLAQAIHASHIPVVSGVGHEDDLTIADMVADVRALTPSEAAERVVPNQAKVMEWLVDLSRRWGSLLRRNCSAARHRLEQLASRPCLRRPDERLQQAQRLLEDREARLHRAIGQRLLLARAKLESHVGRLESLSPLRVLGRGYSLTRRDHDQMVVRDPTQVRPGDRLLTQLEHGYILSDVLGGWSAP